eukprot:1485134-Prymnesium_polylepis.1
MEMIAGSWRREEQEDNVFHEMVTNIKVVDGVFKRAATARQQHVFCAIGIPTAASILAAAGTSLAAAERACLQTACPTAEASITSNSAREWASLVPRDSCCSPTVRGGIATAARRGRRPPPRSLLSIEPIHSTTEILSCMVACCFHGPWLHLPHYNPSSPCASTATS